MTLHDLENAVTGLSPDELARFRSWFIAATTVVTPVAVAMSM